jgi:hypothetical protein
MKFPTVRIPRAARALTITAIAAGAAVAAILPAGAAVADQSPSVGAIRVESPANLLARGAALSVRTTVVCEPGNTAFVGVEVSENVSGNIALGFGSANGVPCTGGFQTIDVAVTNESSTAFRKGSAFARANLSTFNTPTVSDQRTIQIVR